MSVRGLEIIDALINTFKFSYTKLKSILKALKTEDETLKQ